jgi:hypothetical protein
MSVETMTRDAIRAMHVQELDKIRDILRVYGPETDLAQREALHAATRVIAYLLTELERIENVLKGVD